ncbi:MAG: CBS domain-containing protein [Candidatus Woesebacteria bacterium]|nr:CBS domain-containing protein [Candidatus Woesebacteria bacterium]
MKKVKDVIAGQTLRTIDPGQPVGVAYHQMDSFGIHALAVFDGNKFVGLFTLTNATAAAFGQNGDRVKNYMTPASDIVFASPEDSLSKCGEIMNKRHFHHMPVKDPITSKVVGMVSSLDLQLGLEEERNEATETARDMPAT